MQKVVAWLLNLFTRTSVLITGLGIGWLLGLSVSPVVSIVITSIAGIAAAVITTISGLEGKSKEIIVLDEQKHISSAQVNPRPLAALIIGIVLGSIVGICARTNDWFGTDISLEVKRWSITGLDADEKKIASRLFEREHPYTPYAEDLNWMRVDASSGITIALAAEVELWTQLGIKREDVARRLFDMKYPLNGTDSLPTSTLTAESKTKSADLSSSFDLSKTGLYLSAEDMQKCGDLLRYSYAADPDGVSKFREQVLERSGIELFRKLAAIILDDEMLYRTLQTLCENS